MSTPTRPFYHQLQKPNWVFWLAFALVLFSIPFAWYTASISQLQVRADDCFIRQQWGRDPSSGFPEFTAEQIQDCLKVRGAASTYFFIAALDIIFNMIALEALAMRRRNAYIAFGLGIALVLLVSLIMGAGVPWPVLYFNVPVFGLLYYLKTTKLLGDESR